MSATHIVHTNISFPPQFCPFGMIVRKHGHRLHLFYGCHNNRNGVPMAIGTNPIVITTTIVENPHRNPTAESDAK